MRAIPRIATQRHFLSRLVDSRPFGIAVFVAVIVTVIVVNLEKL